MCCGKILYQSAKCKDCLQIICVGPIDIICVGQIDLFSQGRKNIKLILVKHA